MAPLSSTRKVVLLTFGLLSGLVFMVCAAPPNTPVQAAAPTALPTAPLTRMALGRTFTFPPLPEPNGYDGLKEAGALLQPLDAKTEAALARNDVAAQREYVTSNAQVLALIKQALQLPIQKPLKNTGLPAPNTREMVSLLQAEGALAAQEGDIEGAVNSALDTMLLSVSITRGGTAADVLYAAHREQIGYKQLWALLPKLNSEQSRYVQDQLARIEAVRPLTQEIFNVDEYKKFVEFEGILREAKWDASDIPTRRKLLMDLTADEDKKGFEAEADAEARLTEKDIAESLMAYWDAQLVLLRQPYKPAMAENHPLKNPLLNYFTGIGAAFRLEYEFNHTGTVLLRLTAALHAYQLDKGQLPDTLEALTPDYLPRPLTDPFAPGQSLHYKRNGQEFSLYSVGPDGKNDGGQQYNNEELTGDVVAPLHKFAPKT